MHSTLRADWKSATSIYHHAGDVVPNLLAYFGIFMEVSIHLAFVMTNAEVFQGWSTQLQSAAPPPQLTPCWSLFLYRVPPFVPSHLQ